MRFPSEACINCEARHHLPAVLRIDRRQVLPRVDGNRIALAEGGRFSKQEIGKAGSGEVPVECGIRSREETVAAVQVFMNPASADSKLVVASFDAQSFAQVERRGVLKTRIHVT